MRTKFSSIDTTNTKDICLKNNQIEILNLEILNLQLEINEIYEKNNAFKFQEVRLLNLLP